MQDRHPTIPRWRGAVAGSVAAAVALGVGELAAAVLDVPSPLVAVGNRVIGLAPPPMKDLAISVFGSADKLALIVGTVLILLGALAAVGVAATRRLWYGLLGIGVAAVIGGLAALLDVGASILALVPSLLGMVAAMAVLVWLLAASTGVGLSEIAQARRMPAPANAGGSTRREFLVTGGLALIGAAGAGTAGRYLQSRLFQATGRERLMLPAPATMLDPVPSGASVQIEGVPPFVSSNANFYRVDTALTLPRVDVEQWRLRVTGMVDRQLALSWWDLAERDLLDVPITLTCVSNPIGGDLVDTARWRGVRLEALLAEAGVSSAATQIVGRSVDGYTCGFPVDAIDGSSAMVAIGFNGEPLPLERGFPARLVVPGLYGYVSATKWLQEIELTRFEDFDQYWVPRGYAQRAPIHLMSKIDAPQPLAQLEPGPVAVGGTAWHQPHGIAGVQVRVDDGDWRDATLAEPVNGLTWRQWRFDWEAAPGRHDLAVRAISETGQVQTDDRTEPRPDGATGWHSIAVLVSG